MFSSILTNPLIYLFAVLLYWSFGFFKIQKIARNPFASNQFLIIKLIQLFVIFITALVFFNAKVGMGLLSLLSVESESQKPDVIVMLRGGFRKSNIEGVNEPNSSDLERLNAAIWWQKQHPDVPLVIAGVDSDESDSLEKLQVLKNHALVSGIPEDLIWLESASSTTFEHPDGLRQLGFMPEEKIGIVTSIYHERRARMSFSPHFQQLIFIPKKVYLQLSDRDSYFLPSARGVDCLQKFLHEIIGIVYYQLKLWIRT